MPVSQVTLFRQSSANRPEFRRNSEWDDSGEAERLMMASDYNSIRTENERRYGTDIARIGPMLLANRYADRTHFIFELLQNAEDALARRGTSDGPRTVNFNLSDTALCVSHFGT